VTIDITIYMQTNETPQLTFQWEVSVLYTEEWLKTLGGLNPFISEDPIFVS